MKINVRKGRQIVNTFSSDITERDMERKAATKDNEINSYVVVPQEIKIPENYSIREAILTTNNIHSSHNKALHTEDYDTSSKFIPSEEETEEDKLEEVIEEKSDIEEETETEDSVEEPSGDSEDDIIKKYEEEYGDEFPDFEPINKKKSVIDNY